MTATKKIVLLAGGSGGIGAALLEQLIADPLVAEIHATCSRAVSSAHPKLTWHRLDYTSESASGDLVTALSGRVDRLDALLCATGVLHDPQTQPEKNLASLHSPTLDRVFRLNASGPLTLLAQCAPLLKAAHEPRVLMLSAQVGSIDDNRLGGWYGYRMAKAALNMGVKTAAIEAERWRNGASLVSVHPGTTTTELSKPFIRRRKQPVQHPQACAALIYALLEQIDSSDSGTFLTARGEPLAW